jgi:hypothetical protein
MFVLRSAFWLTFGFLVVAPHGTDFGVAATGLRDQAVTAGVEAGSQLLVSQVGAQALPVLLEMTLPQNSVIAAPAPSVGPVVLPRPKPAALS